MITENVYQAKLIKRLHDMFPEAIILKTDPNYIQGIPDILILEGNNWALLESKREKKSDRRPNQEYYIDKANEMSYASFIDPESEEKILDELQQALRTGGAARLSIRK